MFPRSVVVRASTRRTRSGRRRTSVVEAFAADGVVWHNAANVGVLVWARTWFKAVLHILDLVNAVAKGDLF